MKFSAVSSKMAPSPSSKTLSLEFDQLGVVPTSQYVGLVASPPTQVLSTKPRSTTIASVPLLVKPLTAADRGWRRTCQARNGLRRRRIRR